MSTLSPEQWQALSPYLDQALALTDEQRAAWLSSLSEQDPALAEQLRTAPRRTPCSGEGGFPRGGPGSLPAPQDWRARLLAPYTAGIADRPGRHGKRVAGGAQRRPFRAPGGGEVPQHRARRPAAARSDSSARAAFSGGSRIRTSRNSSMPACRQPGNRISSWNMSRASTSTATATTQARRGSARPPVSRRAGSGGACARQPDRAPRPQAVERAGEQTTARSKLLDFGIAKLLEGEGQDGAATLLTVEGGRAMTPGVRGPRAGDAARQ